LPSPPSPVLSSLILWTGSSGKRSATWLVKSTRRSTDSMHKWRPCADGLSCSAIRELDTSLTSTQPMYRSKSILWPSSSCKKQWRLALTDGVRNGPSTIPGMITTSCSPSLVLKSQAAFSASVLDTLYQSFTSTENTS